MARYPSIHRNRRRSRRLIYIISALVIVAVVIIFGYRRNKGEVAAVPTDVAPENETKLPVLVVPEPALLEIALEPTAEPNPQAAELIAEAMVLVNAKPARIIEARDRLNEALPMPMSESQRAVVKKQLSDLADKWLFSRTVFPQDRLCGTYKVKPGEMLSTIGKRFKVPYEILMEINKI
ncbi:MAG TPA: LysM peptidoglycan-binding domain-containing protein, partial [Phycisphaerales bacterium]|nr:LysM peptidoglycan-binding domain-containing protein [Phycisphaerales bacterium]